MVYNFKKKVKICKTKTQIIKKNHTETYIECGTTGVLSALTFAFAFGSGNVEQNPGLAIICGAAAILMGKTAFKNIVDIVKSNNQNTL